MQPLMPRIDAVPVVAAVGAIDAEVAVDIRPVVGVQPAQEAVVHRLPCPRVDDLRREAQGRDEVAELTGREVPAGRAAAQGPVAEVGAGGGRAREEVVARADRERARAASRRRRRSPPARGRSPRRSPRRAPRTPRHRAGRSGRRPGHRPGVAIRGIKMRSRPKLALTYGGRGVYRQGAAEVRRDHVAQRRQRLSGRVVRVQAARMPQEIAEPDQSEPGGFRPVVGRWGAIGESTEMPRSCRSFRSATALMRLAHARDVHLLRRRLPRQRHVEGRAREARLPGGVQLAVACGGERVADRLGADRRRGCSSRAGSS